MNLIKWKEVLLRDRRFSFLETIVIAGKSDNK